MKYLFAYPLVLLVIVLSTQFSFAADPDEYTLQRTIQIGDGKNAYGKKAYGKSARAVMEEVPIKGTTQTEVRELIKRSIAADKPTATKVGSSMLKRIYSPQAIVGTAAVTGLLAAIGWVMENGVYVKKVPDSDPNDPNNVSYSHLWRFTGTATLTQNPSNLSCTNFTLPYDQAIQRSQYCLRNMSVKEPTKTGIEIVSSIKINVWRSHINTNFPDAKMEFPLNRIPNPNYDPVKPPKTVPLTAALLGAAMLGKGYKDPDPNFNNDTVNTDKYTSVKETYEKDPSGVGNERSDEMDDKLKNAKPTDDGKPSYVGHPKYDDKPLSDNRDDTSDRSWDEKGDESTGDIKDEKDPETDESTGNQSITIKFPLFCSWASKMCLWYDDWKASDKIYKEHMTKTEDHQASEKSFWATVKDWFDWTKKEEQPENDDTEVDLINEALPDVNTSILNASGQCPPDFSYPFPLPMGGTFTISYSYATACYWFSKLYYIVVSVAWIIAFRIVTSTNTGNSENG